MRGVVELVLGRTCLLARTGMLNGRIWDTELVKSVCEEIQNK